MTGNLLAVAVLLLVMHTGIQAQDSSENLTFNLLQGDTDTEKQIKKDSHFFYSFFSHGSNEVPFWLYANRHGLVQPESKLNLVSGLKSDIRLTKHSSLINFTLGAELVNRFSDRENAFYLQQLVGTAQYGKFILRLGRFYRLNDFAPSLSGITSGFMLESDNAIPYPRISLETDGFVEVPHTAGTLLLRFRYSDGILENNRAVSSPFIHQKSLQLKGVIRSRFSLQLGVFHSVIWAGMDSENGQLPQSFNDYLRVVFSLSASEDSEVDISEKLNRLGNSNGVFEAGIVYQAPDFRILAYRHLYLEDEFSVKFQSPWDGIWGLGFIKNEKDVPIQAIIYEHLNSIRQEARSGLAAGRANFYNNGIYKNGFSYKNRVLGNPLFTYDPETNQVINNIILAHHLGISGAISGRISYRAMFTYSRNYGVCEDQVISGKCNIRPGEPIPEDLVLKPRNELRKDNLSGLVDLNYLLLPNNNLHLHLGLAADAGDFMGRRVGFMAGFSILR